MLNNIPVHLIIFVIVLAFSGLNWLYRQLQLKAEQNRRELEAARRSEALLRTGREDEPSAGPARSESPVASASLPAPGDEIQRRLREIAERRRAQLEELRRRSASAASAAGGSGSGGAASGGGSGGGAAGAGSPVAAQRMGPAPTASRGPFQRSSSPRPKQSAPRPSAVESRARPKPKPRPAAVRPPAVPESDGTTTHRLVRDSEAPVPLPAADMEQPTHPILARLRASHQDQRDAIVLAEIFGRPVCER
ncbi:MAG: hypothetical protein JNM07_01235 [Phycisphaerae bacterium]|nr:hypothetical protein [Phycisphaerae bacterium]